MRRTTSDNSSEALAPMPSAPATDIELPDEPAVPQVDAREAWAGGGTRVEQVAPEAPAPPPHPRPASAVSRPRAPSPRREDYTPEPRWLVQAGAGGAGGLVVFEYRGRVQGIEGECSSDWSRPSTAQTMPRRPSKMEVADPVARNSEISRTGWWRDYGKRRPVSAGGGRDAAPPLWSKSRVRAHCNPMRPQSAHC